MAKEIMPFELARHRDGTPVTRTSEINHGDKPLDTSISGRDTKINDNSGGIESKVNALISAVQTLIQHVVFHSGVPYGIPQQLMSDLSRLRIGDSSASTTALCGNAICGNAICGTN